jgi:hypothetical protein
MVHCESNQDSKLWDVEHSRRITEERCSMSNIHKRKHELVIPGTLLEILDTDVRVPVLLVHRGVEDPGWDIIAPKGWGMPLLHLFQYAGCRPGSFQTIQVDGFENGNSSELFDLPETEMYQNLADEKAKKKLNVIRTTPKKYRIQYPWDPVRIDVKSLCDDGDIVVWHTPRVVDLIIDCFQLNNFDMFCTSFMVALKDMCKQRPAFENFNLDTIRNSCVRVELKLKSGKVGWNAAILKNNDETIVLDGKIKKEDVIGYVLRGGFSFSDANSRGIGIVSLKQLFGCKETVGIRNITGRKTFQATYRIIP